MSEIPKDVIAAAIRALMVPEHGYVDSIAAAILVERKRCADIATRELGNTERLLSNPPKSSAAWDIRNAINSGEQPW